MLSLSQNRFLMDEARVQALRRQFFEKLSRDQAAQISGLQTQVSALVTQISTQREHILVLERWISTLEGRIGDVHSAPASVSLLRLQPSYVILIECLR